LQFSRQNRLLKAIPQIDVPCPKKQMTADAKRPAVMIVQADNPPKNAKSLGADSGTRRTAALLLALPPPRKFTLLSISAPFLH
jgi:hypothetical protein